jgi:hypothetical protein
MHLDSKRQDICCQPENLQERRGEAIGKLAKIISGWIYI